MWGGRVVAGAVGGRGGGAGGAVLRGGGSGGWRFGGAAAWAMAGAVDGGVDGGDGRAGHSCGKGGSRGRRAGHSGCWRLIVIGDESGCGRCIRGGHPQWWGSRRDRHGGGGPRAWNTAFEPNRNGRQMAMFQFVLVLLDFVNHSAIGHGMHPQRCGRLGWRWRCDWCWSGGRWRRWQGTEERDKVVERLSLCVGARGQGGIGSCVLPCVQNVRGAAEDYFITSSVW